ncbi:MAG TPA: hypothetical protein ACFYD2_10365, partial [Candidatus Avalokitesvara rifleensis]|uniref:hypothetical protein n=1 Tax=Candidatus Avalokitesvara rifleensis TaxID=3367620 RepID=UPI004029E337
ARVAPTNGRASLRPELRPRARPLQVGKIVENVCYGDPTLQRRKRIKMSKDIMKKHLGWIIGYVLHKGLRPCSQSVGSRGGFSFFTVIIVMAMLGIAAGVAMIFSSQLLNVSRERLSRDELADVKQAMTGNPKLIINDGRADFGYIGNMGGLPSSLEGLYKKGSQPAFTFDITKKVGAGWKGPYIAPLIIENIDSLKQDPFGNDYVYSTTQYTRADGEVVVAKITSKGEDGAEGNSDDRFVEVLKREVFGTVTGKVLTPAGGAVKDTSVVLNTPGNGVLAQKTATTDVNGAYSFSNVTFGLRSIQIAPKLSYVDGTAEAVSVANDDLDFKIINMGENAITLNSLKAEYTGTMFYERIIWGTAIVWRYDTDGGGVRGASGETKTWSASKTINGTGKPSKSIILRVEESSTTAPTITLKGTGDTKFITLLNFTNTQTGTGSAVVVSNVTFTITFSDGSTMTFTAAP